MANSNKKSDPIDPNAFSDTIKAQDGTDDVIPKNEEWYSINLNRTVDEDSDLEGIDLTTTAVDDVEDQGTEVTKSSSFYEGQLVPVAEDSDDVVNTDLGGVTDEVTNEDTVSAKVGVAGHPGDDSNE